MFKIIWEAFLDIFFPKYCVSCGKIGDFVCKNCFNELDFLFNPNLDLKAEFIDGFYILANYSNPMDRLIKEYKYKGVWTLDEYLADLLYEKIWLPEFDYLTFVPIHRKRFKERMFNQSQNLAIELSKLNQKKVIPFIKKVKNTAHQASSKKSKLRFQLQKNSFCLRSNFDGSKNFKNKNIVIVDDVVTTGSTMNEIARILKEKLGVGKVYGLALAHKTI
jgi:competence protein ComFC